MQSKSLRVLESNEFVNSRHILRVHDFRLLYLFLSQRDQRVAIDSREHYTIYTDDYAEAFGLTRAAAYMELVEVGERLYEQSICIGGEETRLIQSIRYSREFGGLTVRWAEAIVEHLADFKGSYSTKYLEDLAGMKTIYGVRLYRLLTQYSIAKFRRFKVAELRELLGVGRKYERFGGFRKSVVDVAVRDIFEATGKGVRVEEIKRGRKVWEVRFGCLRVG